MNNNFEWIKLGNKDLLVEVMTNDKDLTIGMGKYELPPPHPMLFVLGKDLSYITMRGVSFPLDVLFFDKQKNPLPVSDPNDFDVKYWLRMYPESKNRLMPKNTYYMIEFPTGIFLPK